MITLFIVTMILDLKNLDKQIKANKAKIKKLATLTYECK
jgi:hypothetical protein